MGLHAQGLFWFGVSDENEEDVPFDRTKLAKVVGADDGDALPDGWNETLDAVLKEHGCELVTHCSWSEACYGIALGEVHCVYAGETLAIPSHRVVPVKDRKRLQKALAAVGWTGDKVARWNLGAMFG